MQWIAIDLTAQRAWLMDGENVLDERRGATPAALVGDWTGPQIIAGMPDAKEAQTPCKVLPVGGAFPTVKQASPAQRLPHAAAVAGFLDQHEDWDGIVCLVGPQVHWVHVSTGEIVSFASSVTPALAPTDWTADDFDRGFERGSDRPEWLLHLLASAQAAGAPDGEVLGLLVGADLKAARPYVLGQQVAVIGDSPLVSAYVRALKSQGTPVTEHGDTTLRGLIALYRKLAET